jgi:hypothetical protein
MSSRDRNAARFGFRRFIKVIHALFLGLETFGIHNRKNGRRQGGFPVVHVADCAHVHVRLGALKYFCHTVDTI